MGWSWRDLLETPADVVEALVDKLNERSRQAASQQPAAPSVARPRRRR